MLRILAMKVINPANGRVMAEFKEHTPQQVNDCLEQATDAFKHWSGLFIEERAACMRRLAALLKERVEHCSHLITMEMGKPIAQARTEIAKCAAACEYYADSAAELLQVEEMLIEGQKTLITFEPLGVVLGIMPWNFPFWQVFRFAVPALMAGNGVILKHAPNVPGCAMGLEALFVAAGFPQNIFRSILISNERAADVIADTRIKGVSFTGSERGGAAVATLAGKYVKKCVLELGGSDPFIVCEDADMESCVQTAITSRLNNCGQSCIAGKRFIVAKSVLEPFCNAVKARVEKMKVGDPSQEETEIGPLARKDLLENLERQVNESVAMGAKVVFGGKRINGEGYFYPPTMLLNISEEMPVYREETFGPVYAVIGVDSVYDAIRVANDTVYGLGASVWTRNDRLGDEIARKIAAGTVYINGQMSSNISLPFGGIKNSGYGRELSHYGIKEFMNIKTIVTKWWLQP